MEITYIFLIVGIVLCTLGILMIFGQPSILLARYEWFHKLIRKKMKSADRKLLSKWYSILFFVAGIPLTIGAIVGLILPDTFELFYLWLLLATGIVGLSIGIYFNISKRFIVYEENIE
ncbi:MAG: hypothetical protein ACTSSG_00785 [Candidatus Heimdallarchaeaceae archaeon]